MELDDKEIRTGNGVMVSCAQLNVHKRVEECLVWLRDKRLIYRTYQELAVEFGKHGTKKFFPLPLFVGLISEDQRFYPYLGEFMGYKM